MKNTLEVGGILTKARALTVQGLWTSVTFKYYEKAGVGETDES